MVREFMRIEVESLTKRYRDADRELTVIDNLSFSFPDRGSVAIIGRSGTGKSTLMHLLGALDIPSSGSVTYGDTNISALRSDERAAFRAKNIGFIFQFHHLLPEFNAVENVALPLIMSGVAESEAHARASALLDKVGLAARKDHLPSQLSGGEQQRVAIARALVARPAVVLADEPTGNLDIATAAEIQRLLLEINREQGSTLIIVTHNHELARSLDMVVEMHSGGALVVQGQGRGANA
jgi:lipoprotein-releasing system ATP-binding protein